MDEYTEQERGTLLNHLKKYIEVGGFPEVVVKGYDYTYLQTLFDIKEGADVARLIQVCHDIDNPKTKARELKSLVLAAGELDCRDLLVITWDREGEEEFKGCDIRFVPLWKWLQG